MLGVTSIVRALNLDARYHNTLIDHFHDSAVKLDRLTALWTQVVLRLFPQPLRVGGRCVLVGDGIKIPKCGQDAGGQKAPGISSPKQCQARIHHGALAAGGEPARSGRLQLLRRAARRAHPQGTGVVQSRSPHPARQNAPRLLSIAAVEQPFYFVADAYYAAHKIVAGLLKQNNHLLTRMKSNAVAYTAYQQRGPRICCQLQIRATIHVDREAG